MQGDINSRSGRARVVSIKIQEQIKCRSRIRIQKSFSQSRLADFADGQILPFVAGITKTQLPVPSLEIIAKFPQLSAQTNIEEIIVVSELFMSGAGVVDAAKLNPRSDGETASVGKKTWNSRISDGERIKRILDWHTNEKKWAKAMLVPGILNGLGISGTADSDASKNERTYLKSANSVRYLSHTSRVNEP